MAKRRATNQNRRFPLRHVLIAHGVTQAQLAKKLAMSASQMSALCSGRVCPGWRLILKISRALSADLGDFEPEQYLALPVRPAGKDNGACKDQLGDGAADQVDQKNRSSSPFPN